MVLRFILTLNSGVNRVLDIICCCYELRCLDEDTAQRVVLTEFSDLVKRKLTEFIHEVAWTTHGIRVYMHTLVRMVMMQLKCLHAIHVYTT